MRAAGIALRGEIRDYCAAGLYLAFARPAPSDIVAALAAAPGVRLEFSREDGGAARTYRLDARVARSQPTGLGVQVSDMAADVLRALAAAAKDERTPRADRAAGGVGADAEEALNQQCNARFAAFLKRVMQDFFDRATEDLNAAGDTAVSIAQRASFGEAARELAEQRGVLHEAFARSVRVSLRELSGARQATPAGALPVALSLVEDDQFEDWLNLSTVAHRLEADLSLPLVELHRRYGVLRRTSVDRSNCPFGPEVICRSFQEALNVLNQSTAVRAVAYRTFGLALSTHCPALYASLNETLASLDPVTSPAAREARAAGAGRSAAAGGDRSGDRSNDRRNDRDVPDPPLAARESGEGESIAEILETLRLLQARHPPAGGDAHPDDAGRGASPDGARRAGAAVLAAPSGDRPDATATDGTGASPQRLLRLIDHLLQAPALAATDGAARPPAPDAGPTPDLGALAAMIDALPAAPHSDDASSDGAGRPAAPSLTGRLARALGGVAVPAPIRQTLDTTGGLLDRAMREAASVPEIQALLERLERPLLKLALRDPSFLDAPDHPARRTVDLLDQYAMATDASGRLTDPGLQRFLHRLVGRITDEDGNDPALFDIAQRNLARLLGPVRRARAVRVAELQRACEARDAIRRAERRIDRALARRMGGRPLPAPVARLLDAGWRHHLLMLELRVGPGHEARLEALSVVERLARWLRRDGVSGPEVRATMTETAARIEAALVAVNLDREQPAAVVAALMRALEAAASADATAGPAADADAPDTMPVRVDADDADTDASDPNDTPPAPSDGAAAHAAAGLRPGDWCLVTQRGARMPMQLVWTSADAGHCAFATRSAAQKLELSMADLARGMDSGLIERLSDQDRPLLERSEFGLLDEGRQALRRHAMQDAASGLLNRKGFMQHLQRVGRRASDAASYLVGVLEFDQIRMIYTACGGDAAEGLVRRLANEVRACLGPQTVLAGFRDDTLAVLLPDPGPQAGHAAIDAMLQRLADWQFRHGEQRYSIGLNVGIARYSPGLTGPEESVRRADAACVAARAQGRNRAQFYEPGSAQVQDHESLADWAGRIDDLLEGDGLYLRCQRVTPIGVEAASLPYYEVLLGIEIEPGVAASPMSFVPAVERLKRSHELDLWVMRQVFDWIARHPDAFERIGGFAINVSPLSLASPEIVAFLHERLSRHDVPAAKIAFEITETAAIESYGAAQDFIREIRPYGCKFSLDDFGSGYTSYAHLKNLRTDSLKIDGSFVKDMATSETDYAMVKSMHEVARSLGMRTVAEYVESPQILAKLREIGVDYAQGYAIHRPCRIDELSDA